MELHFTGHNLDVTPALKTFATEKMQKLQRHHATINNVNITFHVEHLTHIAEANVHLHGVDIHVTAKADDMYAAIDELVDKLIGQITKHKEKHGHH